MATFPHLPVKQYLVLCQRVAAPARQAQYASLWHLSLTIKKSTGVHCTVIKLLLSFEARANRANNLPPYSAFFGKCDK